MENSKGCFEGKELYIGIDVHKVRWVVSVRTYDLELKTFSMSSDAEELERKLLTTYPGALFHIVYDPPRRTVFPDFGFTTTFTIRITI